MFVVFEARAGNLAGRVSINAVVIQRLKRLDLGNAELNDHQAPWGEGTLGTA